MSEPLGVGIHLDVDEKEYHADPCERPTLSYSIAKILIEQSPLHAWLRHPKLGNVRKKPSDAMKTGSLIDTMLLGGGQKIRVIDAKDFRTNDAKYGRDAAEAAGELPVLAHKYEAAESTVREITDSIASFGISLDGSSQAALVWEEEGLHGPVLCRGKVDNLALDRGTIYELKTANSVNPTVLERTIYSFGYDIQWAAYTHGLGTLKPELAGRVDFVWLFCETEPPYAVTPARPDGVLREIGMARWARAIADWSQCLHSDKWPTYTDEIIQIGAPPWAMSQEMGESA